MANPSRKVLRKVACGQEAAPGTYVDGDVDVLLPFTSCGLQQKGELIEDESIIGIAFKDLPIQGVYRAEGPIEAEADLNTLHEILYTALGAESGGVYTAPATINEKSLSFTTLDEVKKNRYAGCFLSAFHFKSEEQKGAVWSADILGYKAESRVDDAFPTIATNPGTRLAHHHAGGSGYCRIGDQVDALASGDNYTSLKMFDVGLDWKFAVDYANSRESLLPLSGAGGTPEGLLTFQIARHDADTFMAWRDARTALQMDVFYYVSATKTLLVEVPNFIIESVAPSEDDIARQECVCKVARNGTGTSYSNGYKTFVSPVRFTRVNT